MKLTKLTKFLKMTKLEILVCLFVCLTTVYLTKLVTVTKATTVVNDNCFYTTYVTNDCWNSNCPFYYEVMVLVDEEYYAAKICMKTSGEVERLCWFYDGPLVIDPEDSWSYMLPVSGPYGTPEYTGVFDNEGNMCLKHVILHENPNDQ